MLDTHRNWQKHLAGRIPDEEIDDVLQDAYLSLWRNHERMYFEPIEKLRGYFTNLLRNRVAEWWRDRFSETEKKSADALLRASYRVSEQEAHVVSVTEDSRIADFLDALRVVKLLPNERRFIDDSFLGPDRLRHLAHSRGQHESYLGVLRKQVARKFRAVMA